MDDDYTKNLAFLKSCKYYIYSVLYKDSL